MQNVEYIHLKFSASSFYGTYIDLFSLLFFSIHCPSQSLENSQRFSFLINSYAKNIEICFLMQKVKVLKGIQYGWELSIKLACTQAPYFSFTSKWCLQIHIFSIRQFKDSMIDEWNQQEVIFLEFVCERDNESGLHMERFRNLFTHMNQWIA